MVFHANVVPLMVLMHTKCRVLSPPAPTWVSASLASLHHASSFSWQRAEYSFVPMENVMYSALITNCITNVDFLHCTGTTKWDILGSTHSTWIYTI